MAKSAVRKRHRASLSSQVQSQSHQQDHKSSPLPFIIAIAIASRFAFVALGIASFKLVGAYDSSAQLDWMHANTTISDEMKSNTGSITSSFTHWDSEYFLHIAQTGGYDFEQNLAFFPVLPISIRFINDITLALNFDISMAVCGMWLCNTFFTLSVIALYKLTLAVSGDRNFATRAALLHCISPASVFFSRVYTESMYACFSWTGMWMLERCRGRWQQMPITVAIAIVCMVAATGTRSNGITQVIYVVLQPTPLDALARILSTLTGRELVRMPIVRVPAQRQQNTNACQSINYSLGVLFVTALLCLAVVAPLAGVLAHAYWLLCAGRSGLLRPWCLNMVPNVYGFVQKEYWGVGFLTYYELKQIPNFILALPMVLLAGSLVCRHLLSTYMWLTSNNSSATGSPPTNRARNAQWPVPLHRAHPYVLHTAVLLAFALTSMHVQVMTRLIFAAAPAVYWQAACLTTTGRSSATTVNCTESASTQKLNKTSVVMLSYCWLYSLVGTIMFSSYYPWT